MITTMTPFRFGPPERPLYGIFHLADTRRTPNQAVLLCNPFGQEAVRIHRFYRVLAERLARVGIHALRFDYFGTGESGGEDEEGNVELWIKDIQCAHQELGTRSRATQVTWVGARLGATLCAMASASTPTPPHGLLLWDPVADGTAYLDELSEAHAQAIANSIWAKSAPAKQHIDNEAIGFGIGPQLIRELRALAPSVFSTAKAQHAMLINAPQTQGHAKVSAELSRAGIPFSNTGLEVAFDWTSEEALNTALVPANALQLFMDLIDKGSS